MRIEGYIEHPNMKITIFKMDGKYSVKFETAQYEQTYKLRTGGAIDSLEDVKKWVTDELTEKVLAQFNVMHRISLDSLLGLESTDEEMFDVII